MLLWDLATGGTSALPRRSFLSTPYALTLSADGGLTVGCGGELAALPDL
ncbi:hypothetical protein ACWGR4_03725 [Embleya sp. NPDC055664]